MNIDNKSEQRVARLALEGTCQPFVAVFEPTSKMGCSPNCISEKGGTNLEKVGAYILRRLKLHGQNHTKCTQFGPCKKIVFHRLCFLKTEY